MERKGGRRRTERLYTNTGYEENPAAGPAAMRAIGASFLRRAEVLRRTDRTLASIDGALGPGAPDPKPSGSRVETEEAQIDGGSPRRRLGGVAILVSQIEDEISTELPHPEPVG